MTSGKVPAGTAEEAMTDNHYKWLEAQRDTSPHPAMDRACSARLQDQLIAEIQLLEAELSALRDCGGQIDFSRQQTCREMIHSRQRLFLRLR
jgi:hypothetical protein